MNRSEARDIFVENLERIMRNRGITQANIVANLNTNASTVSDWVIGKKYPRVDSMQRLADYLDVTMAELTTKRDDQLEQEIEILKGMFLNKEVIALSNNNNPEVIEINYYESGIMLSLNGKEGDFNTIFFSLSKNGKKEVLLGMLKRYC